MPIKNSLKNDVIVRGGRYEITIPWNVSNGPVPDGFTGWSIGVYLGETHESDVSLLEYTTASATVTLNSDGDIMFTITDDDSGGLPDTLSKVTIGVWRLDDGSENPLFKGSIPLSDVLASPTTTTTTTPP